MTRTLTVKPARFAAACLWAILMAPQASAEDGPLGAAFSELSREVTAGVKAHDPAGAGAGDTPARRA